MIGSLSRRRIREIARCIATFAPEVVVVPFWHLWAKAVLDRLPHIPRVVVIHDPKPHPGLAPRLHHHFDRRLAGSADQIVVHSAAFVAHVVESWHIDRSHISVIPLGPLTDYERDSGSIMSLVDRREILCFGRLVEYKGIDVLLDAAPLIRRSRPDLAIRIVGTGLAPALAVRAASEPNVVVEDRWVPEREVSSVFSTARVVVLPYTSATQSGVIPIAAAFGLPVVASDLAGLREQLDAGRLGRLVPPGQGAAIADAVLSLCSDPTEATRLGTALRDEYLGARSWENIAADFTRVCRAAIQRREQPSAGGAATRA